MEIWIAIQDTDHNCYNLLAKTKKDLVKQIKQHKDSHSEHCFYEAYQIDINTNDLFNLIDMLTGEAGGRGYWIGDTIAHYAINTNTTFKKIAKNSYVSFDGVDVIVSGG